MHVHRLRLLAGSCAHVITEHLLKVSLSVEDLLLDIGVLRRAVLGEPLLDGAFAGCDLFAEEIDLVEEQDERTVFEEF